MYVISSAASKRQAGSEQLVNIVAHLAEKVINKSVISPGAGGDQTQGCGSEYRAECCGSDAR